MSNLNVKMYVQKMKFDFSKLTFHSFAAGVPKKYKTMEFITDYWKLPNPQWEKENILCHWNKVAHLSANMHRTSVCITHGLVDALVTLTSVNSNRTDMIFDFT